MKVDVQAPQRVYRPGDARRAAASRRQGNRREADHDPRRTRTRPSSLITAKPNATPGPLANMVVRAQMDFEGKAEVDAPISLKVVP